MDRTRRQLLRAAARFGRARGKVVCDLVVRTDDGQEVRLTVPRDAAPPPKGESEPAPLFDQYDHSPDFHVVTWHGQTYAFTPAQGRAVALLWAANQDGTLYVPTRALLKAAGSSGSRVADLFKRSPAWGVVIAPHPKRRGLYCLSQNPPSP